MRQSLPFLILLTGFAGACQSDGPSGPTSSEPPVGNANLGRTAFQTDCAGCHATADGFDLALFGFSDTTIIRRALGHVDMPTALDIVAYIRSLHVTPVSRATLLFQPGGTTLTGDLAFAVNLFGADRWPTEFTTVALRAIDPRNVQIALPLPVWSDEGSNLDWMPDSPLPDEILGYAGRQAEGAVAGYRAAPSKENLIRAVTALRIADRAANNPAAPCRFEEIDRVDYRTCFEVRRWTASLVAQHLLRFQSSQTVETALHDIWWDVGNAARKSRSDEGVPVAEPVRNWAAWMYLGWSFNPSLHPSVYTGGGIFRVGLPRHATFVVLRSQVARVRNSPQPYDDFLQAVRAAPPGWTASVAAFAIRHLQERLDDGEWVADPGQRAEAVLMVQRALVEINRRVPADMAATLTAAGTQVLTRLEG